MIGSIFITSTGYDPKLGKHVKDPYLGRNPSLGACHPDVRKKVSVGDHVFVVSGKLPNVDQFVMGGFEVAEKIHALEAFERFPERRLKKREDGQLDGNIIVNDLGMQHSLDSHKNFERRLENYLVGKNPICFESDDEVELARKQTLIMLQELFEKDGASPIEIIGRGYSGLSERQVIKLLEWAESIRSESS